MFRKEKNMKHTNAIRIVALLLAMLMLVCMVACSDNGDSGKTPADTTTAAADNPSGDNSGDASADTTTVGGDVSDELKPDLPEVSYAGKTITFLEREI